MRLQLDQGKDRLAGKQRACLDKPFIKRNQSGWWTRGGRSRGQPVTKDRTGAKMQGESRPFWRVVRGFHGVWLAFERAEVCVCM